MEKDWLYRLALNRVKGIGPVHAKTLFRHFGEADAIFREKPGTLQKITGIQADVAEAIAGFDDFPGVEKELSFLQKHKIRCLFFMDAAYPQRLLQYDTAPAILFYLGNADLNASKIISVVGTRTPSEYGKAAVESLFNGLEIRDLLVVSGLAFGIDAAAHKAAINHQLLTVGVLGHGLDRIYPNENTGLARQIIKQGGGLMTRFSMNTKAEEYNFPLRNRIVAGICDALIVVETAPRGGSMLTVGDALKYHKKIFAIPGRITDKRSSGCNALIREGKAILLSDFRQLIQEMKWDLFADKKGPAQAELFSPALEGGSLSPTEKAILAILREKGVLSSDELMAALQLSSGMAAMPLLNLELQGCVCSLPGKRYRLCT